MSYLQTKIFVFNPNLILFRKSWSETTKCINIVLRCNLVFVVNIWECFANETLRYKLFTNDQPMFIWHHKMMKTIINVMAKVVRKKQEKEEQMWQVHVWPRLLLCILPIPGTTYPTCLHHWFNIILIDTFTRHVVTEQTIVKFEISFNVNNNFIAFLLPYFRVIIIFSYIKRNNNYCCNQNLTFWFI